MARGRKTKEKKVQAEDPKVQEPKPEEPKVQVNVKTEIKEENNAQKVQQKNQEDQEQLAKPKKYVKKSIEALQRIQRSKYQRIFLLDAQRKEDQWKFHVLGTTGSQYHVNISTTVKCTCTDFRFKKKPCKHIFFIVTQVSQNDQILNYFRSSTSKISQAAYRVLDKQLLKRLKERMNKQKADPNSIDLKDETDCTICFCEMDKQTQDLQNCKTCKKYFHVVCLNAWKNHNPTCPLCRTQFADKGTLNDPLGKLKQIKI